MRWCHQDITPLERAHLRKTRLSEKSMKCVVALGTCLGASYTLLNSRGVSAFSTSAAFSRRERRVGCQGARWGIWGTPTKAPAPVSPVALGLQEQLRKLCADKSEPDREARIEELAKVRHQHP